MERQGRTLQCYFYFYFKHGSKVCGQGAFYLTQQHRTLDMGERNRGKGWWVHSNQKDSALLWWCCGPLPPAPEDSGASAFTLEAWCSEKHLYGVLLARYPATSLFEGSTMDWGERFWSHSWSTERSLSGQKAGNWWWEPAGTEKGFGWWSFRCFFLSTTPGRSPCLPFCTARFCRCPRRKWWLQNTDPEDSITLFSGFPESVPSLHFSPSSTEGSIVSDSVALQKNWSFFGPRNLQL